MRKIILFLITVVLLSYTASATEYITSESKYIIEGSNSLFSGVTDWRYMAENRHNDNILLYDGMEGIFTFYNYHGEPVSNEFQSLIYYTHTSKGSVYVTKTWYLCEEDDVFYGEFLKKYEEGNENYKLVEDGIGVAVYEIYDDSGTPQLSRDELWEIKVSTKEFLPHFGEIFVSKSHRNEYYWFDKETGSITDVMMPEQRFEKIKVDGLVNYYDNILKKNILDGEYSDGELLFISGNYYFLLWSGENLKIKIMTEEENRVVLTDYIDDEFSEYNFYDPFLFTGETKKDRTRILELRNKDKSVYIDETGEIRDKIWFDDIMSGYPDRHLIYMKTFLPDSVEIKYGEIEKSAVNEFRRKSVFLQGREIIPPVKGELLYLDDYYFCVDDYSGERKIYDIEGNFVMPGPESRMYHMKNNCLYTIGSENDEIKIKEIKIINPAPKIYINGEFMLTDTLPRIKNGRTLVPLRAFAEMMEFQVKEPDEKGRIEISKDGKTVAFTLGSLEGEKDGEKFKLEAAPEIINNRTLVPVRALAEAFECEVLWNGETTEVVISN